jgi:hypothetical protein
MKLSENYRAKSQVTSLSAVLFLSLKRNTQLQSTNTLQFGLGYNSQHNMPGNSDKSSEKPKLAQTVQTLLAAKNGNEKQKSFIP